MAEAVLILREQDREKLRVLLLEGMASGPGRVADAAYFDELRAGIRRAAKSRAGTAAPASARRAVAVKAPSAPKSGRRSGR
ncbi:MAG TPA: hypothetical protein VF013_11000 [Candidatus Limnocylindria bacterium]